ncbi:MAG: hypothetical protein ABIQ93_02360 [Saprospiraceae bacterium]
MKVYEGTEIWNQCQTIKNGNAGTDYAKLYADLKMVIPPQASNQYALIHDKKVVENMQADGFAHNLALYDTGGIGETQEYLWVSEAVKHASQGQEVSDLVKKIIAHFFLLPDLEEAKENLQKRFAVGSDTEPDFEKEICPLPRHSSLPQFGEAIENLRQLFNTHLPEYRQTPLLQDYPAFERLNHEIRGISLLPWA